MRALSWVDRSAPGPALPRPSTGLPWGTAASHPWCRRTFPGEQDPGQGAGPSIGAGMWSRTGQQPLPSLAPDLLSYGRRPPRPRSQRPALSTPSRPAPGPPLALEKRGTVSHRPQTRNRSGTPATPLSYILVPGTTSKFSPMPFLSSRGDPGLNTPPGLLFPKKFYKQKSARARPSCGRFSHFMGSPVPFSLDSPFQGRGGAIVALSAAD